MNNVLVLQRSGYVAPPDYYKVGSSPSDTIRKHDSQGQIRDVDRLTLVHYYMAMLTVSL